MKERPIPLKSDGEMAKETIDKATAFVLDEEAKYITSLSRLGCATQSPKKKAFYLAEINKELWRTDPDGKFDEEEYIIGRLELKKRKGRNKT